jgi:RHS repeat-associated protein
MRLRSLEGLGLATAVDTARAYALIDGPRTDVGDSTRLWLDRWGAPRRIVDALEQETVLTRGDERYPALVTRTAGPVQTGNVRRVLAMAYDARGNPLAQTDSSSWRDEDGVRTYATTRYAYEDADAPELPSRITSPEGEVTLRGYDGLGRLSWVQQGQDSTRRTRFGYHPLGGSGAGLPSSVTSPLTTAERYSYDALGNLEESTTTDGGTEVRTRHERDALGRDTAVVSASGARAITRYQGDHVAETLTIGPAATYRNTLTATDVEIPEQRLRVHSYLNAEGRPDSVARWQSPDPAGIGRIVTRWRYDALGRTVQEIGPDGTPATLEDNPRDSTIFDAAGNAVAFRSRRGLWTRTAYDALNRARSRTTDAVSYAPRWSVVQTSRPRTLHFPLFAQDAEGNFTLGNSAGGAGVTLRGDTATFEYDAAGNLVAALNRDAVVRREYNLNGTLRSETQRIRTYAGPDTAAHTFRLEYAYDLNGRRTALTHPEIFGTGEPRHTRYGYDTISGALAWVQDPGGGGYTYRYDEAGRVAERVRGPVRELYLYDATGRLERRQETTATTVTHKDVLRYEASTGKLVSVDAKNGTAKLAYSGMGALAYSDETDVTGRGGRKTEAYTTDALGNQLRSSLWGTSLEMADPGEPDVSERHYEPGTARLVRTTASPVPQLAMQAESFDPAGNRVFSVENRLTRTPYTLHRSWASQTIRDDQVSATVSLVTTSYYGADERLRVVDRRGCLTFHENYERQACDQQYEPAYERKSAFEEYRYDALGRRVLVRTRQEYACTTRCFRQLRRTVWDGDQVLYEIAARGASGTGPEEMERDTGVATPFKVGGAVASFFPTGRVEYVHGAELDAPLAFYRAEYSDSIGGGYYVPRSNWRGAYDGGYSVEQCYTRAWTTQVAPPIGEQKTGTDTTVSGGGSSGTDYLCPSVEWPAQYQWAAHQIRRGYGGPQSWMGSLIYDQRDASGLHYRRNRFYDAEQGRFTQEDPIGLAGGINLYGFAAGDPVTYSDPYGLWIDFKSQEARLLWNELARHVNRNLQSEDRDIRNAARHLRNIMNDAFRDQKHRYTLEVGNFDGYFEKDTGGGAEDRTGPSSHLIQVDDLIQVVPYRLSAWIVLAHELGGAQASRHGDDSHATATWWYQNDPAVRAENAARALVGCSRRRGHNHTPPTCHR